MKKGKCDQRMLHNNRLISWYSATKVSVEGPEAIQCAHFLASSLQRTRILSCEISEACVCSCTCTLSIGRNEAVLALTTGGGCVCFLLLCYRMNRRHSTQQHNKTEERSIVYGRQKRKKHQMLKNNGIFGNIFSLWKILCLIFRITIIFSSFFMMLFPLSSFFMLLPLSSCVVCTLQSRPMIILYVYERLWAAYLLPDTWSKQRSIIIYYGWFL